MIKAKVSKDLENRKHPSVEDFLNALSLLFGRVFYEFIHQWKSAFFMENDSPIEIWVKSNFVTTWFRDISSCPTELRDKMHFVTSVCVKRYVDGHEHMSRSYTSKSPSYRLSRTCAGHEPICREHPTPLKFDLFSIQSDVKTTWTRKYLVVREG